MGVELCECNNCGSVMIDENPQPNQIKLPIEDHVVISMEWFEDQHGGFWGCPICGTDGFLSDKENWNNGENIRF